VVGRISAIITSPRVCQLRRPATCEAGESEKEETSKLTKISLPWAGLSPALLVHQAQDQPPPATVQTFPLLLRQKLLQPAGLGRENGRLGNGEELGVRRNVGDGDETCTHSRDGRESAQRRD